MRASWLSLLLTGCGALSSGSGAPTNAPASGVGPTVPFDQTAGLTWSAPFIIQDPARACAHPSVIADGEALDLWVGIVQGEARYLGHARLDAFDKGFGELEDALRPSAPWEQNALSSPAVVRATDERFLFYLGGGQVGLARATAGGAFERRATPLYADPRDPILSIGAALRGDRVRIVLLVGDRIDELELGLEEVRSAAGGGGVALTAHPAGITLPSWAVAFLDVSLRIERTPAGRLREDLLFGAALPNPIDLGVQPIPTAVGAATRYLPDTGDAPTFELPAAAILTGPPYPRGPVATSYRGGVLLLYSARSGPRDAIGVALRP